MVCQNYQPQMKVRQKILVKYLSKYFLFRIKIPSLVEIPSWPGRRELPIRPGSPPSFEGKATADQTGCRLNTVR